MTPNELKFAMEERGMSVKTLSKITHVTLTSAYRWLKGTRPISNLVRDTVRAAPTPADTLKLEDFN